MCSGNTKVLIDEQKEIYLQKLHIDDLENTVDSKEI